MSDQAEILKAMQAHAEAMERLADGQKEARVRLLELEQKLAKRPLGGYGGEGGAGGIAELVDLITKSSGAEAFGKKNTPSFSVEMPTRMLTKNTIINATGSGQPLVASDRAEQRGIVFAPQQRLTIRGLFSQIPTSSNLIERPAEQTFTNSATEQGGPSSPAGSGEGEEKAEAE